MIDHSDYIQKDNLSLYLENLPQYYSEPSSFLQCSFSDKNINIEIEKSLNILKASNSFAFFDLFLNADEKFQLNSFTSDKFQEKKISSIFKFVNGMSSYFYEQQITKSLEELGYIGLESANYHVISKLIMKIANAIYGNVNGELDLLIRTAPPVNYDCIFWHIDKDLLDFANKEQIVKRFVIPLSGVGTFYQEISSAQRSSFFNYSSNFPAFWGHGYGECTGTDEISKLLLSNSFEVTRGGYGSVHYLGEFGAIHSEPSVSQARFVLIFNEIKG